MNEEFPAGDAEPGPDLSAFHGAARGARRASSRSLLAGVTVLAVVGGGALGFVWLSTPPAATAEAFNPGTRVVPPVVVPTTSPDLAGAGFVVSKRDLFASTVDPSPAAVAPAPATSTNPAVVVPVPSLPTAAPSKAAPVAPPVAPPVALPVPAAPKPAPATPKPAPPKPAAPAPAPTPTPSRSTAPPFEISTYVYTGLKPESKYPTNFAVAPMPLPEGNNWGHSGWSVLIQDGTVLYPADITFQKDVGGQAWITSNRGVPQEWFVPQGKAVPAAAMGDTKGTVRVVGMRSEKDWLIQVNRERSVIVSIGEQVPGTPLVLKSAGDVTGKPRPTTSFTDADGVVYQGAVGAGETDGVSY
ncbi:hypothetical protein NUM3379_04960 [Kineococcus sp. NUM-3379]